MTHRFLVANPPLTLLHDEGYFRFNVRFLSD